MTRSNLYITLSNGKKINCVAESSSAPEQGYIVEDLIIPLLKCNNTETEVKLLAEHCTMHELRANAYYRYTIDLFTKEIRFFEETYNYTKGIFKKPVDITERLTKYVSELQNKSGNL